MGGMRMRGNNTIQLNMATLITAIEFYLNEKVMREPVRVETVDYERGDGFRSGSPVLVVKFSVTEGDKK
jgi:hypothetical protein